MNTGNHYYILKTAVLIVFLWLTAIVTVFSQDYLFDVDMINVEDGLPHRNTYAIVQDKEGFIWVSTLAGISRYDGYNFKAYDKTVLRIPESNAAHHLALDKANRIWYCGKLDPFTPVFYSGIIDSRRDSIYTMETISGGRFGAKDVVYVGNSKIHPEMIFVATRSGIVYEYDGNFKEIYRAPYPFSGFVNCEAIADGSYWITNGSEVIRVKNGKSLQSLEIEADYGVKRIVSTYPDLILEIKDTAISFAADSKYWKLEKDAFVPFTSAGHAPQDIKGLLQVHQDYNCYTTKNKLLMQNKQGNTIYTFDELKESTDNLSFPLIENTLSDRQNILWAATGNGILKISTRQNPFKHIGPKRSVRGIYRDEERLWVDGFVINMASEAQKQFQPNLYVSIISFYKDDREQLWMGTNAYGLLVYMPDTDKYINYEYDRILSLHLISQNAITKTYWVGSNNGIFRFDPATKKITPFPLPIASEGVYIRQFYQNATGIWIVSDKGIFLMDAEKEVILKHYITADGLPTVNLNYLYEDTEGIFWLGAKGGGLIRWDLRDNSFRQYTREDGLSNNNIYTVYEDEFETLWLPSDYGLMAFNKNTETAKVYLPRHGIAHEEFNTFSHFQDKDGTLYFGGLQGVTSFHPRDLRQDYTITPPLYATKVRVLEKDAEDFTDNTSAYLETQKIALKPNDRILELELSLLDYEKPGENRYAYKLTGHQEQWLYTSDNKLSIINLPYGRYDLVIKARGASGTWSENPLSIPMHVKAPFYLQWWFILAMALAFTAIVFSGVRWRVQKLKKDRQRLEGEVQKRTQKIAAQAEELKALDKAKTRFFSNITHEFRTPLTLITGPAEQLLKSDIPAVLKSKAQSIRRNSGHLLGLINQLLDLSKLESKGMVIEISYGDIVRYTRQLLKQFQPLADKKALHLEFIADTNPWKTHFDKDKWHKTVYNLLSNAIKFTPEGGHIHVNLQQLEEQDQEYIQLVVKDTGVGIEADKLDHIFNRFYQADASSTRLQEGTGIGLALVKELTALQNGSIIVKSSPGEGAAFIVKLPVAETTAAESAPLLLPQETDLLYPVSENIIEYASEEAKSKQEKSPGERLELLIAEDNAEMRAYIRSCLDTGVYRISEAGDGAEGITKARELVPDLIISDVMMPGKNGFELTHAIRNHIVTSHIPLILLTAKASLKSRLKGLERGADAYLTKPFSSEELALRVQKLIELRRLLQQRYQKSQAPLADAQFQKEDAFIAELNTYIDAHITESGLGAETISRHFAVSRMQLYRKLKALTNTTISNYIQSVRLEKAVQLLKEKQLNMSEVAYATGFSSLSYFSRTFKKVYGKSPSEAL